MASPTQWTWVWVNSGSWWWTGRPDVLRSMELQRVGHDWATKLNWTANETRSGPLSPVGCASKKAVMSSICSEIPTNRRKKADPGKRHPEKVRDSMSLKNLNNKEMNLEGLRVVVVFLSRIWQIHTHSCQNKTAVWIQKHSGFMAGKKKLWWHFICLVKLSRVVEYWIRMKRVALDVAVFDTSKLEGALLCLRYC